MNLHTDHFLIYRSLLFLTKSPARGRRTEQTKKKAPPTETHTPTTEHPKYTEWWLCDKNAGEICRCLCAVVLAPNKGWDLKNIF